MATLSDVKFEFFKIGKLVGIIGVILLVVFFILQIFMFFLNSSKRNQPTIAFGKLTKIDFPNGLQNSFSYSVDTITGALPALPSQLNVYQMEKGEPNLLAVDKTSEKLANLGFQDKPTQVSDILYRWSSQNPIPRSITVNVVNPQFTLTSDFINDKNVLSAASLPSQADAISQAQDFIDRLGFLPDNIDDSATKVKLLKIQNGTIIEASSVSNAQLISVYFFQKKNDIPFVYPAGDLSSINLTIGSGDRTSLIVDGRFFYEKVSDKSATYPLITISEAFDKLKNGGAYIASYNGKNKNITIKKAYLAYYIEGQVQNFLEPVVVFEGNDNFFAYVPAVKDEWVNN